MVRTATRSIARCIYIYRNEFGHITKSVGDINSMEESTREEFTDVDLLTNLDEMDNLDPIEKAKFTTVLFTIACLLAAIISFLT